MVEKIIVYLFVELIIAFLTLMLTSILWLSLRYKFVKEFFKLLLLNNVIIFTASILYGNPYFEFVFIGLFVISYMLYITSVLLEKK